MATPKNSPSEEGGDVEVLKPVHPAYLTFTEDSAKQALIDAWGDIFIASQMLGITAIRLNRAVKVSPVLQATLDELKERSRGTSAEDLHSAIAERLALYRVAGLDALHELATMPIDENSAQNQVKLAAAARLAGTTADSSGTGELADTLRELNERYEKDAPRIRVIRSTAIEISPRGSEDSPERPPLP